MYAYSNNGVSWRAIASKDEAAGDEVVFEDHPEAADLAKAFPGFKSASFVMHRIERNRLLQVSDWTQLPDNSLNDKQRKAWASYRQALRDLPASTKPGAPPAWPKAPE